MLRNRKVIEYHRNEVAEYFRGEIEDHILFIKRMLKPLTALATYNAETEDAEVRADQADDMKRGIEYRLGEITREVEDLTRLIKGGKNMQNWIKDECNAYFTLTEEELEGLLQKQEDTDAPEDPELTEEQEQALLEEEDEILARLRDIDPAYDYVHRI